MGVEHRAEVDQAALVALARHPGFGAGQVDTGLIARDLHLLTAARMPDRLDRCMVAAAVLCAAALPQGPLAGFALWAPLRFAVRLDGVEAVVEMAGPDAARVELAGDALEATRAEGALTVEGCRPAVVEADGAIHVFVQGRAASFRPVDPLDRRVDVADAGDLVRAPMPGLVRQVPVRAGQAVPQGARLAVIEAMKMEHALTAPRPCRVAEVMVAEGAQVEAGMALIRLEDDA